jgi:pyridoxamine 5'-phosphate oxidase
VDDPDKIRDHPYYPRRPCAICMNKEQIYQFLTSNPAFQLATAEGNIPHVRTLMLHKSDETGIYFMVGKFKDVYRQISLNPQVELCFHKENLQVRISGIAENLDKDIDLKKEILEARPFLKPWIEKTGLKYLAVFRVAHGTAVLWRLETEMEPMERISL